MAGSPIKIAFSHDRYNAKSTEYTLQTGHNTIPQVSLMPKPVKRTLPPSPREVSGSNNPEIVIKLKRLSYSYRHTLEYKVVGEWKGMLKDLKIFPSIIYDYEKNKKVFGVDVKILSPSIIALYKREYKYGRWSSWSLVGRKTIELKRMKMGFWTIGYSWETTFKNSTGWPAY